MAKPASPSPPHGDKNNRHVDIRRRRANSTYQSRITWERPLSAGQFAPKNAKTRAADPEGHRATGRSAATARMQPPRLNSCGDSLSKRLNVRCCHNHEPFRCSKHQPGRGLRGGPQPTYPCRAVDLYSSDERPTGECPGFPGRWCGHSTRWRKKLASARTGCQADRSLSRFIAAHELFALRRIVMSSAKTLAYTFDTRLSVRDLALTFREIVRSRPAASSDSLHPRAWTGTFSLQSDPKIPSRLSGKVRCRPSQSARVTESVALESGPGSRRLSDT